MIDLLVLSRKYREQFVCSYLHISWVKLDSPFVEQNGEMWVVLFVCFVWSWRSVKYPQLLVTRVFFPLNKRNDEKLDLQWTLEGHQLGVVSVDISHTGSIAASSSLDAHIRLWDLETGKQIKSIDAGPGKISVLSCLCVRVNTVQCIIRVYEMTRFFLKSFFAKILVILWAQHSSIRQLYIYFFTRLMLSQIHLDMLFARCIKHLRMETILLALTDVLIKGYFKKSNNPMLIQIDLQRQPELSS